MAKCIEQGEGREFWISDCEFRIWKNIRTVGLLSDYGYLYATGPRGSNVAPGFDAPEKIAYKPFL
jgi:hypothetical protein